MLFLSVSEIDALLFLFPILYSQTSAFPDSWQATNVYNAHESIDFNCKILAPFYGSPDMQTNLSPGCLQLRKVP